MLFSAYPSILPAASWPPAGKAGGCSDERGSIQKTQKETRQTGCLLRLFISSARRKETPCHFIHSSPVNLSVLLNILHSFRNDRAHYTLCFRRSSLTYSALTYFALTYFAQGMLRGKQIFPAQCTARLLIQGYCSRAFGGCIVGVFP